MNIPLLFLLLVKVQHALIHYQYWWRQRWKSLFTPTSDIFDTRQKSESNRMQNLLYEISSYNINRMHKWTLQYNFSTTNNLCSWGVFAAQRERMRQNRGGNTEVGRPHALHRRQSRWEAVLHTPRYIHMQIPWNTSNSQRNFTNIR